MSLVHSLIKLVEHADCHAGVYGDAILKGGGAVSGNVRTTFLDVGLDHNARDGLFAACPQQAGRRYP